MNLGQMGFLRVGEPEGESDHGLRLLSRIDQAKAAFSHVLEKGYNHWIVTYSGGKE